MIRPTHTYATLLVSDATYQEIKLALSKACYDHAIIRDCTGREIIDMTGIGLVTDERPPVPNPQVTRGLV
jgi:hypothetical protein